MIADRSIDAVIPVGASMIIDTSVILAYLTGTEAISRLATELFDRCLATGRNAGGVSMITVTELLVRPFRSGAAAVASVEGFVGHFADLRLLSIDYVIAREAARIRATTGLATPDSLIAATFVVGGQDVLVTNDASWPARLEGVVTGRPILVLGDLLA